jgi:TonB-dependent starch-binding outer membrane protein SusC
MKSELPNANPTLRIGNRLRLTRFMKGALCIVLLFLTLQSGIGQNLMNDATVLQIKQGEMVPVKQALKKLEQDYQISFNYNSKVVENKFVDAQKMNAGNFEKNLQNMLSAIGLKCVKVDEKTYIIQNATSTTLKKAGKSSSSVQGITPQDIQLTEYLGNETNNNTTEKVNVVSQKTKTRVDKVLQERTISGKILGDAGEPLPGINVVVKGTTIGTITDVNGAYTLNVPDGSSTLVFSSVGYLKQEVEIGAQSAIDITLKEDIGLLEELVVVGYGEQERAKVTGAIASVSSKTMENLPVLSAEQALQGNAAGVNVISSGSPGENPLIRIRGIGTVNNNSPLYVIDGIPAGGLNSINPSDIESIQVLKDASTAAIYGSRASNGVILITTKKGKSGKAKVTLDSYWGTQKAWKQLDLMNTDQYIDYANDLINNFNNTRNPDEGAVAIPARFADRAAFDAGPYGNINTDWQDEMFRTALIQDHNIGVSGGSENFTYLVGAGYFGQEGIMLGTDFSRISFRANTEFKISKRIKFGQTLTMSESKRTREPFNGGRSQIEHMIKSVPYLPVYDANNVGGFKGPDNVDGTDPENPVLQASLFKNVNKNFKVLGTAYLEVDIYKGLKARGFIGMDFDFSRNENSGNIYSAGTAHSNSTADINNSQGTYVSPIANFQLMYEKEIGKHNINVQAIVEGQKTRFENVTVSGETNLSTTIEQPNFFTGGENIGGNLQENSILSYIGRVTYDYADKYLFGASIRRDGSSRFAEDVRWGTFPAFSVGWRVSEEEFMQGISNIVSEFKIRASYGTTGNNQTGNYGYVASIFGNTRYGASYPGGTLNRLSNPSLTWETTKMLNIGFDASFLDSKFTLSLDWFKNNTEDMILDSPLPLSIGYDVPPTINVGAVENKGIELMLGYRQSFGEFNLNVSGNMTFVQNELTKLASEGSALFGPQFEGLEVSKSEVGEPIAYFFGYQTDGLFQSQSEVDAHADQSSKTSPGDIRFKDLNNDGVINANDRTKIGHFLPSVTYGFTIGADYKGFDLTMFFQGVSGNDVLNTNLYDLEGMTRLFNAGTAVLNRWTPTNTNTTIPRAINGDPNQNARISDRYIEDGSYLRLKNLTLGYSLPKSILPENFISRVRIYVTGQNLLTFTKYSGYDPEIGVSTPGLRDDAAAASLATGVDYGLYPQPRTILGGIQVTF